MRRPSLCVLTLTVVASLLLQSFPIASTQAQEPEGIPALLPPEPDSLLETPEPPIPEAVTIPLVDDPRLPSLALRLQTEPHWAAVGELITTTITIFNQAPDPATELILTLPLPPDASPANPADPSFSHSGWQWSFATLAGGDQQVITATMRLAQVPPGEALLLQPSATAQGLGQPVELVGGVLVTTTPEASPRPTSDLSDTPFLLDEAAEAAIPAPALPDAETETRPDEPIVGTSGPEQALDADDVSLSTEPSTDLNTPLPAQSLIPGQPADRGVTRFVPGQTTRLWSPDGRISIDIPANAFARPLTLVHRTPAQQRPVLRARGNAEPPEIAGFHRGFGVFHLEAVDDAGRQIKRFNASLTLTVRFTPQQLRVLGVSAEDLQIFWFDEQEVLARGSGQTSTGAWKPQRTIVDAQAGTATLQMDHFSAFQLSDSSSASAAYLPTLQDWQVSGFTGAASYSYPIEVPAGPAGLKPALTLSYSSDATDGSAGMRPRQQSSWVGKGWSLHTGMIALHKQPLTSYSTANHYALSFGGRSYGLMRAEGLVPSPNPDNPTHWAWRPTSESHIRVRAVPNGVSTVGSPGVPGRGAAAYGAPLPRYRWQVWDKDGTRYDFAEDLWWMWARCSGSGDFATSESNRWLLSSVTDVHGNTITYSYARAHQFFSSCMGQAGTVDFDVWPTEIFWAGGRYRVEFVSSARTNDTQFDWPQHTVGGPVRETRQLNAIRVWSNPGSGWQLVRQYTFTYDYSLRSDTRVCTIWTCATWGPDHAHPKLTLRSVQRLANDGQTALPALTFSYQLSDGSSYEVQGGWNRLSAMANGQDGTVSFSYANIALATGNTLFRNRHRLITRTEMDGRGNSYSWNYSYGTPLVNTIGTSLRADDPSGHSTPTSAILYYN